jgi:flagellar protein FliJ
MSAFHALIVALDLAKRRRDDAVKQLQTAQKAELAAQDQMGQLEGYVHELDGRWGMREDAYVKPEVMYHHNQFLGRLNHAMGLQTGVVIDKKAQVQQARQVLMAAEVRVASLQKLIERKQSEAARALAKQEQKQTDERASWGRMQQK